MELSAKQALQIYEIAHLMLLPASELLQRVIADWLERDGQAALDGAKEQKARRDEQELRSAAAKTARNRHRTGGH